MSDAQTILKMIEEVDTADKAKLDEIDARVHAYINNAEYISCEVEHKKTYYDRVIRIIGVDYEHYGSILEYTRSRDALKAIRPDGCSVQEVSNHFCRSWAKVQGEDIPQMAWMCTVGIGGDIGSDRCFMSKQLPTEELAELHAVIQAIDHDRSQK